MKKESNKNIYIFWISILVMIVGVVLFFFIPKPDSFQPYNNIQSVKSNQTESFYFEKNIDSYIEQIKNLSGVLPKYTKKIIDLQNIKFAFEYTNNFAIKALMYLDNNSYYKSLLNKQNEETITINEAIYTFKDFLKYSFTQSIQTATTSEQKNELSQLFAVKLNDLLKVYSNYYTATFNLIKSCSIKCMEVNSTIISANINLITQIKNAINNNTINSTNSQNFLNSSIDINTTFFYLSHFS